MSEGAKVIPVGGNNSAIKSDSDLCWRNVIKINLEARQQSSSEVSCCTSLDALSSLPSVGYSNNTKSSKKSSSEVSFVSDESPPSPGSASLVVNTNMNKLSNNAHHDMSEAAAGDANDPSVQALRDLLQMEEKKLSVLKTIHGLQGPKTTTKSSSIQGSALNKASGRSTGSGSGRSSPNLRGSQTKHSIVVVPGNQGARSSAAGSSSTTSNTGISSRLQQLVDNIAVDQALTTCSERLHSSGSGSVKHSAATNKLIAVTMPPVPGLTSLSASSSQKHNIITLSGDKLFQLTSANNIPQLKPKIVTSTHRSSHEIITIADSPLGKIPPPLLSSATRGTFVPTITRLTSASVSSNGSIQVPTISSTIIKQNLANSSKKNSMQVPVMTESSRRYRDFILKQSHAKKNFQKQMERKMMVLPYPKAFRQVWPLIPVHDSGFVRNYGLESVMHHFDPKAKALQDKHTTRLRPTCNQCTCDFASAWQIRKSQSKQLLLCEACDFLNLKILQHNKLSNQLKELMETVKTEQKKFSTECEEAKKQILDLEKNSPESPPPLLTSQLTGTNKLVHRVGDTVGQVSQIVFNQVSNRYQVLGGGKSSSSGAKQLYAKNQRFAANQQQNAVVIPSILGMKTLGMKTQPLQAGLGASKVGVGTKRPAFASRAASPPRKVYKPAVGQKQAVAAPPPAAAKVVYKPGSMLDQTLHRLSKQLIKRKLDEHRQECQLEDEEEGPARSEASDGGQELDPGTKEASPTSPAGQKSKSRRKGTPKHNRLLSASSANSE